MEKIYRRDYRPLLIVLFVNVLLLIFNRFYVEGLALIGSIFLSIWYIASSLKKINNILFFLFAFFSILVSILFNISLIENKVIYISILITLIVFTSSYALISLIFTKSSSLGLSYTLYNTGMLFALANIVYGLNIEPDQDRLSGIYQNTLNFTGTMCVFYSASFYNSYVKESHLRTIFLVLLVSLVAVLSKSQSIGLTILVSLVFYVKYLCKSARYVLAITIFSLLVFYFDHLSAYSSNQLRIERYFRGLDFISFSGIGVEAFSSLSKHAGFAAKGIFESFILSLFLFSPIYFFTLLAMIFYKWAVTSEFSFNNPKVILLVAPMFAGSFLTPLTLLNVLVVLFSINYLFKRL
jgi:hypothetical protein